MHFAGELLDVDGVTGGFNLQACWTTGQNTDKNDAQANDDHIETATRLKQRGNDANSDGEYGWKRISQPLATTGGTIQL